MVHWCPFRQLFAVVFLAIFVAQLPTIAYFASPAYSPPPAPPGSGANFNFNFNVNANASNATAPAFALHQLYGTAMCGAITHGARALPSQVSITQLEYCLTNQPTNQPTYLPTYRPGALRSQASDGNSSAVVLGLGEARAAAAAGLTARAAFGEVGAHPTALQRPFNSTLTAL
jgi:hypothetical protein